MTSSILDIAGGLFLLLSGIQVVTTAKVHGKHLWQALGEMTRVTSRGPKVLLLAGGVFGLLDALLQPLLSSWIPPFPPLLLIGVSLLALNGACLPPTILYLAASQARGFSLASELPMAVAPLKVVHLLQSFEAGAIIGDQIYHDEYRVTSNWQQAVRKLSAISPLIIVDGRVPSDAVAQEIRHIVESGLHRRTLFVADEYGVLPALSRISLPPDVNLYTVTPEELIKSLRRLRRNLLSSLKRGMAQHPIVATEVDSESLPTMMVIGIDGRFDLHQVLSLTRQKDRELVVLGNRSPAFKDPELLLREARRFRSDTSLVLIFEKFPSRNDPFCLDPLVMVRRSFLLEVAPRLQAATLGEFAILMTIEAATRKLQVAYV